MHLVLVENHDYFYQIQGIMFVTNVKHAKLAGLCQ